MESTAEAPKKTSKPRVVYDVPTLDPRVSLHWSSLNHQSGDVLLHNSLELCEEFQKDVDRLAVGAERQGDKDASKRLAVWSCVVGYCEALTTHKDPNRRYQLYPIPMDAICRLVDDEFIHAFLKPLLPSTMAGTTLHRDAIQNISNAVWARAQNKGSSSRDELHANSLYVCLRGNIDARSLDCFGSAIVTIAGMRLCGFLGSCLTLSEDHAYESHFICEPNVASSSLLSSSSSSSQHVNLEEHGSSSYATCEIAIPGNTKQAKDKRGKEIEDHFKKGNKNTLLTPTTSWLYMRANPVICKSIPMTIAAAVGNINCTILEKMKNSIDHPQQPPTTMCSGSLLDLKRDMLWILHDAGHLSEFPFGLIELGDCEEHRPSPRGNEWVHVPELLGEETILMNEKLFHDAISISRTKYNDSQTYPYFYAGHYHKDAGSSTTAVDDPKEEYRLVEALRLYASASRVASQYTYDSKDSLQLLKHMSAVASLMEKDILSSSATIGGDEEGCSSRVWYSNENALAAATWLLAFFDSLLVWEEKAGHAFVELLKPGNKNKHGWKLFQHLPPKVRSEMVTRLTQGVTKQHKEDKNIHDDDAVLCSTICITSQQLVYFTNPRSKRLTQQNGLLLKALGKTKISINEMELTILQHSGDDGGRRKRARRET